jgi:hypothetical protein
MNPIITLYPIISPSTLLPMALFLITTTPILALITQVMCLFLPQLITLIHPIIPVPILILQIALVTLPIIPIVIMEQ